MSNEMNTQEEKKVLTQKDLNKAIPLVHVR